MTKKITLQDIVQKKTGLRRGPFGGAIKKEFFVESGYKVYEQKNAIYKSIDLGKYYIDDKKFDELKAFEVLPGDFILSCSGTIGEIYQIPKEAPKGVINQALLRIRLDEEKIIPGYFLQLFRSAPVRAKIIDNSRGGAMQNLVSMAEFRKLAFDIPPLEEQEEIAHILSTWDEAIEAVEELIEKNEKKLKALLHYYFGSVDKDSKTKIGSICTVRRGASPRPIKDPKWFGGDTGWVRISDVTSSKKYLRHTQDYLSDEGVNKSVFIEKGEVVLSICATIGRPIIVDMKACIHDGFVWFDGLPDNLDREFFYYQLSFMEEKYKSLRQHGSQGNLNTSIVSNTRLYLPDPEIQKEIAKNLSLLDEQLDLLNKKKHLLEKQKKGLMQRFLTGKVKAN